MRRESVYSGLLMFGGGVLNTLLLCLVARYPEAIDVCMWRMLAFMSVVVTGGSVGIVVV